MKMCNSCRGKPQGHGLLNLGRLASVLSYLLPRAGWFQLWQDLFQKNDLQRTAGAVATHRIMITATIQRQFGLSTRYLLLNHGTQWSRFNLPRNHVEQGRSWDGNLWNCVMNFSSSRYFQIGAWQFSMCSCDHLLWKCFLSLLWWSSLDATENPIACIFLGTEHARTRSRCIYYSCAIQVWRQQSVFCLEPAAFRIIVIEAFFANWHDWRVCSSNGESARLLRTTWSCLLGISIKWIHRTRLTSGETLWYRRWYLSYVVVTFRVVLISIRLHNQAQRGIDPLHHMY